MGRISRFAIVQKGLPSTGKTTTIRLVFDELEQEFPDAKKMEEKIGRKEVFAIIQIRGKVIGFQSMGDPSGGTMEAGLKKLVAAGCHAIVCSCRTKRNTFEAVKRLAEDGYAIDWRIREGRPTDKGNRSEADHALGRLRSLIGSP